MCLCFFLLTLFLIITHTLFQVTINMSSASRAEDSSASRPLRDEDAEAAAVADPGAELAQGGVQLGSAAVDGLRARSMLQTSGSGSTPAALAENPLDCKEYPDKGATAASAKVRHSLTLLVLFCLSFFSNCITLNLFYFFTFTDTASQCILFCFVLQE